MFIEGLHVRIVTYGNNSTQQTCNRMFVKAHLFEKTYEQCDDKQMLEAVIFSEMEA